MDETNVIGNYIFDIRRSTMLDQTGFAERLNEGCDVLHIKPVSAKTVSKWETGQSLPGMMYLKAMEIMFDISVEKLLDVFDFGVFRRTSISKEDIDYNLGLNLLFFHCEDIKSLCAFLNAYLFAHRVYAPQNIVVSIIFEADENPFGLDDGRAAKHLDITDHSFDLTLYDETVISLLFSNISEIKPLSTHYNYCFDMRIQYMNIPTRLLFGFWMISDPDSYAESPDEW